MENEAALMENEPELIRQQMLETRTALTEKLEALEEQVTSKVKDTTDSVAETVETVKEAVENTVQTVSETVHSTVDTVKDTFDVSRHVEQHPWMMFGGAVAVGFVGGRLLDRTGPPQTAASGFSFAPPPVRETGPPRYQEPPPSGPSLGGKLLEALTPSLSKLGGLAIGVTADLVGQMIRESAPEPMKKQLGEVIDEITVALGGTPIHFSNGAGARTRQLP
jgi:ElaB/YqjD/DUF883 family membrane-anchored ribosome-binding protein